MVGMDHPTPATMPSLTKIINALRPYGACDVADALSRLKHPRGGFLPGLIMHSPTYQSGDTKLLGAVQTVQFELNEEKGKKSEIKGHYIDQTRPDTILLLNGPPGISNAIYGGIMSARIKHLGALGVVVSGRFRDLQEQRDLKWPVWARGVGTTAGGEVCFPSAIDVPLKVESWVDGTKHTSNVNPGDIIMADQDGVVCIPAGLAEQVADLVPKLAAVDQKCLEDVKNGRSVTEAFGEHRGRLKC